MANDDQRSCNHRFSLPTHEAPRNLGGEDPDLRGGLAFFLPAFIRDMILECLTR